MTKIEIKDTHGACSITVSGHSGFAPAGQDIVCAGVSTLTFTLFEMIKKLPQVQGLRCGAKNGFLKIIFIHPEEDTEVKTIIDTVVTGYSMLAEKYPENVSLIFLPTWGEKCIANV